MSSDPTDYALYDENGRKIKDFDCVVMKRKLQAIVQEKTKDMTTDELLAYFNSASKKDTFMGKKTAVQPRSTPSKRLPLRKRKEFA